MANSIVKKAGTGDEDAVMHATILLTEKKIRSSEINLIISKRNESPHYAYLFAVYQAVHFPEDKAGIKQLKRLAYEGNEFACLSLTIFLTNQLMESKNPLPDVSK